MITLIRRSQALGLALSLLGGLSACSMVEPVDPRLPSGTPTDTTRTSPPRDTTAGRDTTQRDTTTKRDTTTPPPPPVVGPRPWTEATRWPLRRIPTVGDSVVIAPGDTVALTGATAALRFLEVSGVLILRDGTPDRVTRLETERLVIRGTVLAGSRATPLQGPVQILVGRRGTPGNRADLGSDAVLVAQGGTLALWGPPTRSWTTLAQDANAGTTQLNLAESVAGWRVGDSVVVSTSSYRSREETEVRAIASVSGTSLTLTTPLQQTHWGGTKRVAGTDLPLRAAVGLLSRPIQIAPRDMAVGGHVIIMRGGHVELQGVEFRGLGQAGQIARYPLHWHLHGSVRTSPPVAQFLSIWRTQQRCVVVHGTSDVTLRDLTCALIPGHAVFLEDGAERGTTLDRILVADVRVPDQPLLASDRVPAAFWIQHPDNTLTHNHAAGGAGHGFWYALPRCSTGLSQGQMCGQRSAPLGRFEDNVAHGQRRNGLHVDDSPREDGDGMETALYQPQQPGGERAEAVFRRFSAWGNQRQGAWFRGDRLTLADAQMAGNPQAVTFAGAFSTVRGGVIAGLTGELRPLAQQAGGEVSDPDQRWKGIEFYDGPMVAEGVRMGDYPASGFGFGSAMAVKSFNPFPMHPGNVFRGIDFQSGTVPLWMDSPMSQAGGPDGVAMSVLQDPEGLVSRALGLSRGAGTWTANQGVLRDDRCLWVAAANAWHCPTGHLRLELWGRDNRRVTPLQIDRMPLPLSSDRGGIAPLASQTLTGAPGLAQRAVAVLQGQHAYRLRGPSGPASAGGSIELTLEGLPTGQTLWLEVPLDQGRVLAIQGAPLEVVSTWGELATGPSRAWMHTASRTMWIVLRDDGWRRLILE